MSIPQSFESFLAGIESLEKMNSDVAKAALDPVTAAARETAAAGMTPSGEAWAPKKDGGQALESAPSAIESSAKGTKIELKVGAPFVFHQHGAGGSSTTKEAERHRTRTSARQASTGTASKFHAPRRQIIPSPGDAVPQKMKAAIEDAAGEVFRKAMG